MNEINKIDKLLSDDLELEKYIYKLEKKEACLPNDLKENILSKIKIKKKKHYIDICKIAACLIFSLVVCQTNFMKNDELRDYGISRKKDNTVIAEKVSDICRFLTSPINLEGDED